MTSAGAWLRDVAYRREHVGPTAAELVAYDHLLPKAEHYNVYLGLLLSLL